MYGLVIAPRRRYHRVATDLRNMGGEESVVEPCLWTFRDENGVIHALCLVYVDDFMLACSDSPSGKYVFDSISNLYEWGKWASRVFVQCGAQISQACNKHLEHGADLRSVSQNTRKRFRSSPFHHIDAETRNPKLHHLSYLNFEFLNGQLLWLGMQCLPQLLAPLSLWMGQTPQAKVGTIHEVNKLARKATVWAKTPIKIHGDDEAVHVRMCLKEILFGQLDLQNWQCETRRLPAALVVDCRGVYDALPRSSSSCLGLNDKKSGLEALALEQSLVECGTMIRWCHSAAQLGDVVAKDSDAARAPWELFVRLGFRWKLIHDPKFESSRNRAKRGLDILEELDENEFADDVPRDPKSVTLIT